MKNKKLLQSVAFVLLLCVAVAGVMGCYTQPKNFNTRIVNAFEELPGKTVDGIILGSSVVSHAWVSALSWEKYGLAAYQFGTSVQPFGAIPGFIKYAQKSHDIKYVVIDIHSLRESSAHTSVWPSKVQEAYMNIPDLFVRYGMISDTLDYAERLYDYYGYPEEESDIFKRDKLSNFLPLLTFHNRWVEGLEKADFVDIKNEYLGANDKDTAFNTMDVTKRLENFDYGKLGEANAFQKGELDRLFAFLDKKDLKALFINVPSFRGEKGQKDLAQILQYCKDSGYDTIDFATRDMLEEVGIDVTTDIADYGHVNLKGAEKITDYLCRYLIENGYYYEDHRGQKGYDLWDEGVENYKAYYEKGWSGKGAGYKE